ncbi:heme-degrading domain-containing protein [Sinorhizobium meliloti]|uniref:heme-degrading domain-containing protein n=1 Tax=Rhizobium meliloti TaxID=382 RepID=UPI001295946B|nr:heme-degrading domain-containing protein [Sinorhizobium meliloti]MQW59676.1 heme-degrading domain-containing protein [Sinorhizobium meliloti]
MPASPTVEELRAEEDRVRLHRFDYDFAWVLGCEIRRIASEEKLPIAIEIAHYGDSIFSTLLSGASPDNSVWVRRKRAVVERFHHSSLYMRLLCERNGVDFHARYRLPEADFAASGGGVPLRLHNVGIVGVAAVSGLPDVEDHRLIMRAVANLTR